jgi:hypothetical protein
MAPPITATGSRWTRWRCARAWRPTCGASTSPPSSSARGWPSRWADPLPALMHSVVGARQQTAIPHWSVLRYAVYGQCSEYRPLFTQCPVAVVFAGQVITAPMGGMDLCHAGGPEAVARGAARSGAASCVSSFANARGAAVCSARRS